ncbi:phosphotransferase family protein [Nocardia goodfellowii]|uniref:Aminoglycoside phosphotransferase (APT) family kinase protein n=1 Tax=Nocardia goodfellowii TaxID=882446 RepID=A0ABS4QKI5_9NOCA|nr:aminoglycoside phosphotransferase family protein [Nocardia goodfellowii]MBP2191171.1 aminoglycoside phosphotransferase (APT) family kinase protein [Nocardia goodfellowii]
MSTEYADLTDTVTAHLRARGLAAPETGLAVRALTGGVSNDVVAVTGQGVDVVVKRALSRLRVRQEWEADVGRLITEGRALRLAATVAPESVPPVLDLSDGFLVIGRAPDHWHTWKADLMAGVIDVHVAARLGEFLAELQRNTAGRVDRLRSEFGSRTAFEQLRVDPFHQQIRGRYPDLAPQIDRTIAVMAETTECLVHGDYSPKNVLVGDSDAELWVIDWEVAHLGDPTFDPAWIIGHLLLKSIRRPDYSDRYRAAAATFLDAWNRTDPESVAQLIRQTGCLVLARVDGRSPVDYLDEPAQVAARSLGRRLLGDPPHSLPDAWRLLV